jgi:hypothetical protein
MSKFNLDTSVDSIAEAIVTLKGAETAKAVLNQGLLDCHKAKVKWAEMRDSLASRLELRGYSGNSLRVTLSTIKWCYEQQVQLETLNLTRMKEYADKGQSKDLATGKPKTVKANGKPKAKGSKAKTEATVDHCGIGMAKAMTQQGFIKFLNVLVYDLNQLADQGIAWGLFMDDGKLDMVRSALAECGYMTQDGAEWKVAIIKESDDEVSE